jgi:hypothetical protein
MKNWLVWLVIPCAVALIGSFAWNHRHTMAMDSAAAATDGQQSYAEEQEAHQAVTVTGPLADYMARQKREDVETLQAISYKPDAPEHAGNSPVGTSSELLRKTFAVARIVDVPFELPAHASSPRLHGTYKSFLQTTGAQPATFSDTAADVEFLLLNEKQYVDFLSGRPADALFSADAAHDQEVNVTMPPTLAQPVKYFLVFRNASPSAESNSAETSPNKTSAENKASEKIATKKFVQADFRLDF